MHRRLRGARLAVRAATVAAIIVLDQLAATSSLRVQARRMGGCGQTLGPRRRALLGLRKTLLHERANTQFSSSSSCPDSCKQCTGSLMAWQVCAG